MALVLVGTVGTITSIPIENDYFVQLAAVTGFTSRIDWEALTVENPKELTYLERYAMEPRHRKSWNCPQTLGGNLVARRPRSARFDFRKHLRRSL